MPLPTTLRQLVTEYEALTAEHGASSSQRLADLAYTLCVSTGTREITDALTVAQSYLAESAVGCGSVAGPVLQRRTVPAGPPPSAVPSCPEDGERLPDGLRPAAGLIV
ncbi:DUF5133 domain-containing protein [Streptomyces sp. NPDC057950]|uniref:DUF5133 domain-containing protein n=1 Tax=Streptomyces sp. NPDC057950 TaxID=3346288 RepID=UPI0036ED2FD9